VFKHETSMSRIRDLMNSDNCNSCVSKRVRQRVAFYTGMTIKRDPDPREQLVLGAVNFELRSISFYVTPIFSFLRNVSVDRVENLFLFNSFLLIFERLDLEVIIRGMNEISGGVYLRKGAKEVKSMWRDCWLLNGGFSDKMRSGIVLTDHGSTLLNIVDLTGHENCIKKTSCLITRVDILQYQKLFPESILFHECKPFGKKLIFNLRQALSSTTGTSRKGFYRLGDTFVSSSNSNDSFFAGEGYSFDCL